MGNTVWIMNHYAGQMMFDRGGRHYWFAKYLDRAGYDPVVFCANIKNGNTEDRYFETDDLWTEKEAEEIHTPFVFVKARKYKGNGKQRILNMVDFYRNVKKAAEEYAEKHGKPDIVYASSVHPLTLVAGIETAKHFDVKCISEVRDLWPESIVVYSNRITKNSLPAKLLYRGEKWIYKKSDALIFTMAGGADYIKEHGWDLQHGGPVDLKKVFHINNGVDLEEFEKNAEDFVYHDSELDDESIFKVVYAGSIRRVNKVGMLLDAAKLLDPKEVRFLIYGSGTELDELKARAAGEGIGNVSFKGRVDKRFIPSIVKRADLNIVHWEASPLIRYGDSSNKSFEYFAAGKPVLFTVKPGYSIVERFKCGLTTENQTAENIADAIRAVKSLSDNEKADMCRNAKKAVETYDFCNLSKELVKVIEITRSAD